MAENTQTILIPLSILDNNAGACDVTLGYVLDSVNITTLEAAAKRVVEKWRLLAGRIEWEPTLETWAVRVPVNGDVSSRVKVTASKLDTPLDAPILPVDKSSTEILACPSLIFFRHPSTPNNPSSYASSNAPLLSIHITELANCTCVGISFPHVLFDAFGLGKIIRALHAELHGTPWSPPPFSEKGIMSETLNELSKDVLDSAEPPAALADLQQGVASIGVRSLISLSVSLTYEHFWQKLENKAVYLGEKVVEKMVRKAKDELKKSGKSWVSTADILVAWFLKVRLDSYRGVKRPMLMLFVREQTVYANETHKNTVCAVGAISMRKTLSSIDPTFEDYPHNSLILYSSLLLPREEITSTPFAELALVHRQNIDTARNIPFIKAYHHWLRTVGGKRIPNRGRGTDSWIVTNQVIGQLDAIDFGSGSEMLALWLWGVPLLPDHTVMLNKFKGGYMIQAEIRCSRWQAIAEEIERMKAEETSVPLTP
ncbi:hypothetical protein H0H81_011017 [Sphagnurus paluster]|uniref:Uncharacterized protein n=1 Tax=Sphagnurus paluster TaxID=117069 RepID=A0A9P7GK76_9AGAR|nr:hypothetical protein H0H81_011017 [Sphagnurus paluster]